MRPALRGAAVSRPRADAGSAPDDATVTGAGPATTPCLRSGEPALVWQEFWAWLAAAQLVRASAAAALGTRAADAAAARRAAAAGTGQVSFTTMTRTAVTSMRQSQVTATTTLPALAAAAETAGQAAVHTLVTTGRQRYSARRQKSRPAFPHASATKPTHKGPVEITRFPPGG